MTEQEQRIAIAEWMGWKWCTVLDSEFGETWTLQNDWFRSGVLSPGTPIQVNYIVKDTLSDEDKKGHRIVIKAPDYLHDLNAMHEAEEKLPWDECERFNDQLCRLSLESYAKGETPSGLWPTWHATAAQRAEALLRTIGKWKEPCKP